MINNGKKVGIDEDLDINVLVGKTLSSVKVYSNKYTDKIIFTTTSGESYKMFHDQACCEGVYVDEIIGDLDDLVGSPIVRATEDTNSDEDPEDADKDHEGRECFTWTFYNIATAKGHVTIRWYGESNGYYSEGVNFRWLG